MWTRLRTPLAAVSFLLMLAAIAFSIHGYWAADATGWYSNHWTPENHVIGDRLSITAFRGQFQFRCIRADENWSVYSAANNPGNSPREQKNLATLAKLHTQIAELAQWKFISHPDPATFDAGLLKQSLVGFEKLFEYQPSIGGCIAVPAWFPIALLALLPLHWIDRRYRPRKLRPPLECNETTLLPAH